MYNLLYVPIANAQVASSVIDTFVTDSRDSVTTVLTTNIPILIAFAVSLLVLWFVWRLAKRFLRGRG